MIDHKVREITQPQLSRVHPHLLEILDMASYLAWLWYKDDLIITAIYDPLHPGLTHRLLEANHRFVDARILEAGGRAGSERLRDTTNAAYEYDPERKPGILTIPPLVHESTLDHAIRLPHFHFQIAPHWLEGV